MINKLNEKEKLLLLGLRDNKKNNVLSIANENKIPKSTMFDLYRKFEKNNVIKETILINFEKIGYPIKVFFLIKTIISDKSKFRYSMKEHNKVNSLYMLGSGFDFLMECIFKNFKEVHEFEEEISKDFKILEKNMFNVIDNIVLEKFLTLNENGEGK